MNSGVPIQDFHSELVKDLFSGPIAHEDVKCLMLLLHSCRICLSGDAEVAGGVRGFDGVTTRHAAELAASLFASGEESSSDYWYDLWNGEWEAYSILENPPGQIRPGLNRMREILESHAWVDRIEDEDWDLFPDQDQ